MIRMNSRCAFLPKPTRRLQLPALLLALALCAPWCSAIAEPRVSGLRVPSPQAPGPQNLGAQASASTPAATQAPGRPFTADQLAALLPEKAYFQGQSASLQLRNAGGTRFANGAVVFAALVDTSGYSSAVQQKYQFYFVTETDLRFGGKTLPPGAYGAGFVEGDRFVLMDIGGHTLLEGSTSVDSALQRPRPLQVAAERPDAVRLYVGRRFVLLEAVSR